ncbi:eukaryotic translation initiation factor 4E-binding protein 2 isoform X1 [Ceratina calcarata]|uniref:Eukaryotic translation initiation factor 4E-binding protein 2 isoform X1 n=1 Tax=Ceratina calcarata TaxID=156304 RepID=A0AAJ7IZ23_9HYME|nr:eukaryotic translation initiation factor 4E-binding protein 2 isoform X1 [Ceratina calcarata]XP_017880080.1 eukaryotic translation initiation factor 4E-binding protein 2 isoform X1 [Ceratina calcarata]XP_017880081.1 eukaryotic translation initiation factor 4E-binding protein 2 isoform X1 [Ceratina calcarata]XP_017880082.1 eukaryotic translation initiation factor 4E-binding protein 2 isoform X1 [Ceratina calcarata]
MSASPIARQATQSQNIPSKRIVINDSSQLPHDYSTTPGGTLFSTTPGGTRIVYERDFLMNLRNSPISRTPPRNMPSELLKNPTSNTAAVKNQINKDAPIIEECAEQFEMDM